MGLFGCGRYRLDGCKSWDLMTSVVDLVGDEKKDDDDDDKQVRIFYRCV